LEDISDLDVLRIPHPSTAIVFNVASTSVDDSSTSVVGCQKVEITGLDTNWDEVIEDVWLKGTTPVVTISSFVRVNNFYCKSIGAGLGYTTVGDITLKGLAGVVTYEIIKAGGNRKRTCHFSVPNGYTAFITGWSFGSVGKPMLGFLRSNWDFFGTQSHKLGTSFIFQDITITSSNMIKKPLIMPIKIGSKADIKVSGQTLSTSGEAACSIEGYYKPN